MIRPTVGRVVLFHPSEPHTQPFAAMVAYVHSDRMVNLGVIDPNGNQFGVTSVPLIQDEDEKPKGFYCEWMEYQKGQAAKPGKLEAELRAKA